MTTAARPPADAIGCNCKTDDEHVALVFRVDKSYAFDDERARERTQRSTSFLRAQVLAETNGHRSVRS